MLFAQIRRYAAKGIKSIKPAPELPLEYKFPQWPFINAMEKEVVPRWELLQTFPAGHDGSVGKRGRLATMWAVSGFAPLERGAATGTEQHRKDVSALARLERFMAGNATPLLQGAKTRKEREYLSRNCRKAKMRAGKHTTYRVILPKIRAV